MEDELTSYEFENGVRYVLSCKHSDGPIYFGPLETSIREVDKKADYLLKSVPAMKNRLSVLKIKAFGEPKEGENVMLWGKKTRYKDLEDIFQSVEKARSIISKSQLDGEFVISSFAFEVIKTYKK